MANPPPLVANPPPLVANPPPLVANSPSRPRALGGGAACLAAPALARPGRACRGLCLSLGNPSSLACATCAEMIK
eukprot:1178209-Prorocentrum_minimum.AAC.2